MRVAIVNDLKLARQTLKALVTGPAGCEVAWEAADGQEALERCLADRPDLILMDLIMPRMDGVEATRRIMQEAPCPILVVTATVEGHYAQVYDALGAGAIDAMDTPTFAKDGEAAGLDMMMRRIRTVRRLMDAPSESREPASPPLRPSAAPAGGPPLVALAASTGGPDALVRLLNGLPPGFEAPIVVVQHLGQSFLPGFVSWLGDQTGLDIQPVDGRVRVRNREVFVGAGDHHLVATEPGVLEPTLEPGKTAYLPSADVLFDSLAERWGGTGVAAVLTGMGRDGARGLGTLRAAGWSTLAQDKATSVVYGMPRAAAEAGAVEQVLPIEAMGPAIGLALGAAT